MLVTNATEYIDMANDGSASLAILKPQLISQRKLLLCSIVVGVSSL
jgi:hypothetical protein